MAYYDKNDESVYHFCRNCPIGKTIPEGARKEGLPFASTRCPLCDNLDLAGTCRRGEPVGD
jgi:hypothetical protein